MTACDHPLKYPDLASCPTLQEAFSHCSMTENDEHVAKMRALTSTDGQSTRIDSAYWKSLNDPQRAALLAHERAHPTIGMDVNCEGCADKMGGYFMRAWGYSPEVVRSSFAHLNAPRGYQDGIQMGNIADNAYEGARVAERALAGRGLLGVSGTETLRVLSADRLALSKPTTTTITQAGPTTDVGFRVSTSPASPTPTANTSPVVPSSTFVSAAGANRVADTEPDSSADALPTEANVTTVADAQSDAGTDIAGDIVAGVLGESARRDAKKVLIAAGAAAIVAVVLVVLYRRTKK